MAVRFFIGTRSTHRKSFLHTAIYNSNPDSCRQGKKTWSNKDTILETK